MRLQALRSVFGDAVDVRRGEWGRVLPLVASYGLVMSSLYVLKPARNALFLDRVGVAQLPYVLLLVALFGGLAAVLFTRATGAARLDRLILGTFLFLITNLIGFWLLLPKGWMWSLYFFYVWVNLYGLMSTSLLWLLANAIFNPREARRLFGLVGAGGIAGAIVGAGFTSWIVSRVGTENLLLVCAAMLVCSLLLVRQVWTGGLQTQEKKGRESGESPLQLIAGSNLLQLLGGMAALVAVVAAIADIQFNAIVDEAFVDEDQKTAFFGQFFAFLSAFALLFQLFATPRILRSMGVIPALLFLPLSLAAGSLWVLLAPGLLAGMAVKLGDGGFRHSIHKSAAEILFLPVPTEVKRRTKVLLDTTVDNLATGLGALLVLLLTNIFGVSHRHLGLLSLSFIALWVGLVLRGRGAYLDAFRQALDRREIEAGAVDVGEAAALDSLIVSLDAVNERQVTYALEMLSTTRSQRLVPPVVRLLQHDASEVRLKALRVLQHQTGGVPLEEIEGLVADGDLQVRIEAFHCLYVHRQGEKGPFLRAALAAEDRRWRGAALGYIAERGTAEENALIDPAYMRSYFDHRWHEDAEERLGAARILGRMDQPDLEPYLGELTRELMQDADPAVLRETIASLGRLRDPEHLPWLLGKLTERGFRQAARQALERYGAAAVPQLVHVVGDEAADPGLRQAALRALGGIYHQEVVDALLHRAGTLESPLDFVLIKTLSKLRSRGTGLEFAPARIEVLLDESMVLHYDLLQLLDVYGAATDDPPRRLLQQALHEKQARNLERVFRLLGLQYDPDDMYRAYLGLVGGRPGLRASALEFLDNVLVRETKDRLLPLLDYVSVEGAIERGSQHFSRRLQNPPQALAYLLQSGDHWLRTCATYSLSGAATAEEVALVQTLRDDGQEMVREAVEVVLARHSSHLT